MAVQGSLEPFWVDDVGISFERGRIYIVRWHDAFGYEFAAHRGTPVFCLYTMAGKHHTFPLRIPVAVCRRQLSWWLDLLDDLGQYPSRESDSARQR